MNEDLGERCLCVAGANMWNFLAKIQDHSAPLDMFKSGTKAHVFYQRRFCDLTKHQL